MLRRGWHAERMVLWRPVRTLLPAAHSYSEVWRKLLVSALFLYQTLHHCDEWVLSSSPQCLPFFSHFLSSSRSSLFHLVSVHLLRVYFHHALTLLSFLSISSYFFCRTAVEAFFPHLLPLTLQNKDHGVHFSLHPSFPLSLSNVMDTMNASCTKVEPDMYCN